MHTVILASLRSFFGWLFGQAVLKGLILTALTLLITFLGEWLWSLLPSFMSSQALTNALAVLPSGIWWVLDYARIPYGLPLVLTASVVVFLIRRIPVIG